MIKIAFKQNYTNIRIMFIDGLKDNNYFKYSHFMTFNRYSISGEYHFVEEFYNNITLFQRIWIIGLTFTLLVYFVGNEDKVKNYKLFVFLACIWFWPVLLLYDIVRLLFLNKEENLIPEKKEGI